MTGFAVEQATSLEIIAAWVAPKRTVPAVESTPGWYVVGEYFLPKSTTARLDVIASVSHESLTCRVRLWEVESRTPVPGTVIVQSTVGVRALGPGVSLVGGRRYQVQAECIGNTGDDRFGVVEAATITD